jgi:hypothetical protein
MGKVQNPSNREIYLLLREEQLLLLLLLLKVKLSVQEAVEAYRVVRSRGSYIPERFSDTHFCQRPSQTQGHSAAGRIR